MKRLKENKNGLIILSVFIIIIIFGLTGIWDYLIKFFESIFSGLFSNNPDYIPGENFPFQ